MVDIDMRMIDVVDNTRMIDIIEYLIMGKTVCEANNELNRLRLSTRIVVNYFNKMRAYNERLVLDNFTIRVCVEDGNNNIITTDYIRSRVNVTLKNGLINQILSLG